MSNENLPVRLALVDDHKLFRKGLISLLEMTDLPFTILFEADNGLDLQEKIKESNLPDVILMDINMPGLDGYATVQWLRNVYRHVNVLVISMVDTEESVMRMVKQGVKGYLSKDVEPEELATAITSILQKGFYYTDFITGKLVHALQDDGDQLAMEGISPLTDKELEILRLSCTDLTYNEIAAHLNLSPKTVDGYRVNLFEKLRVKNRVGLALAAVKYGVVKI
jgi:two-component system, NarL family, invasion response regulator UvrY